MPAADTCSLCLFDFHTDHICPVPLRWQGRQIVDREDLEALCSDIHIEHVDEDGVIAWSVSNSTVDGNHRFLRDACAGNTLQEALDALYVKLRARQQIAQREVTRLGRVLAEPPTPKEEPTPQTPLWDHLIKS